MEGHEYGYAIFKPLPVINVSSSSKNTPISLVTIVNTETKSHSNAMVDPNEDVKVHLFLSPEKLINMQNDDIFGKP